MLQEPRGLPLTQGEAGVYLSAASCDIHARSVVRDCRL